MALVSYIASIAAHPAILALVFTSEVAWKQEGLHTGLLNHFFGLLRILVLIQVGDGHICALTSKV